MREWTKKLAGGADLSGSEAGAAALALADEGVAPADKKDFLRALTARGETPGEVAAFARVFRELALPTGTEAFAPRAIDVVGTGGDRSSTFNFSTATALFLASLGVPVMKHGNRSITSKSGSADLLVSLGVDLEAPPKRLHDSLERFSFCFFFAPAFHPAFKSIMPVRKELAAEGIRTIFNILGPLINPGAPAFQMVGVFHHAWVAPIALALAELPLAGGLVVHSRIHADRGIDELSTVGRNLVAGVGSGRSLPPPDPDALGLAPAPLDAVRGGDAACNRGILEALASGKAPRAIRETFALNAAACLLLLGREKDWPDALAAVFTALESGAFTVWLKDFEAYNRSQ